MKRIILILSVLIFSGCSVKMTDPNGYSYYVWVNESDHQITLSGTINALSFENGGFVFENEILQPGQRLEKEKGGAISPPSPTRYAGIMIVSFDDGEYKVIYAWPGIPSKDQKTSMNYNKPYNPTWENNYIQESVKVPNHDSGTRWTYTFTNADYEAAVEYVKAQEE